MFSSKTPRDIIRTPEDDALINNGDFREEEVYGVIPSKFHNEPNPILVAVRKYRAARPTMNNPNGWDRVLRAFERAVATTSPWTDATAEHVHHARAVLTRLANITEGASA